MLGIGNLLAGMAQGYNQGRQQKRQNNQQQQQINQAEMWRKLQFDEARRQYEQSMAMQQEQNALDNTYRNQTTFAPGGISGAFNNKFNIPGSDPVPWSTVQQFGSPLFDPNPELTAQTNAYNKALLDKNLQTVNQPAPNPLANPVIIAGMMKSGMSLEMINQIVNGQANQPSQPDESAALGLNFDEIALKLARMRQPQVNAVVSGQPIDNAAPQVPTSIQWGGFSDKNTPGGKKDAFKLMVDSIFSDVDNPQDASSIVTNDAKKQRVFLQNPFTGKYMRLNDNVKMDDETLRRVYHTSNGILKMLFTDPAGNSPTTLPGMLPGTQTPMTLNGDIPDNKAQPPQAPPPGGVDNAVGMMQLLLDQIGGTTNVAQNNVSMNAGNGGYDQLAAEDQPEAVNPILQLLQTLGGLPQGQQQQFNPQDILSAMDAVTPAPVEPDFPVMTKMGYEVPISVLKHYGAMDQIASSPFSGLLPYEHPVTGDTVMMTPAQYLGELRYAIESAGGSIPPLEAQKMVAQINALLTDTAMRGPEFEMQRARLANSYRSRSGGGTARRQSSGSTTQPTPVDQSAARKELDKLMEKYIVPVTKYNDTTQKNEFSGYELKKSPIAEEKRKRMGELSIQLGEAPTPEMGSWPAIGKTNIQWFFDNLIGVKPAQVEWRKAHGYQRVAGKELLQNARKLFDMAVNNGLSGEEIYNYIQENLEYSLKK